MEDPEWDEIPEAGGAHRGEEGGEEGGTADHRTIDSVNQTDLNNMTIPVDMPEGGMDGLQVDSESGQTDSAETDNVLVRTESSIQTAELRKTFEQLAQASSVVPKPQPPTNRVASGNLNTPERKGSPPTNKQTSPEVVGADGVVYTNEDINVIASMLLNPHKVRGSLQEDPSPADGAKLSKHVREALKVIVCSPSRRASAMLQHFREKERTDTKPILPNFDTPSKTDKGLARRLWKGSSAADRAALAQSQSPFFNRTKGGKKSVPLRPWKKPPADSKNIDAEVEPEVDELGFEIADLQEVGGDDSAMDEQESANMSGVQEEEAVIDGLQADDLEFESHSPQTMQMIAGGDEDEDEDEDEESVDLVQRVLDRLDHVTDMVCVHEKHGGSADDAFLNPKTALMAEVISLRSAQLALIQDNHRAAVGSVQGTKALFERLAFLQCHGDLDRAVSDMERAEQKLQAEIRAMARASADERWAYYSRRGNESLHKASMCLAGGRFDHALAFIAQAKGAFTAIGDADKLSFLQDMNRRVVLEATRHGTAALPPDVAQLTAEDDAQSAKSTQREETPHRGVISPPTSPGVDDRVEAAPLSGLDLLATPSPIVSHASAKVLTTRSFQSPALATPSEDAPTPATPRSQQRAASARVLATRQASVPLPEEEGADEHALGAAQTQISSGPSPKVLSTRQLSGSGDAAEESAGSASSPSSPTSASLTSPSAKVLATRLLPPAVEGSDSGSETTGTLVPGPMAKVLATRQLSPEAPESQDPGSPSVIHGGPSAKVLSTRSPQPRTPSVDLQGSPHAAEGQLEAAAVDEAAMQTPPGASQAGYQLPTPGVITGPQYPPDGVLSTPLPTHTPGWLATTPVDPVTVQGTPEEYQGLTQDPCYLHLNKGGSPFIAGGDDSLTMEDGTGGLVVAANTSLPSLGGRASRRRFVDGLR